MAQGIQVFNADGTLQFDSSNRLFRVLSTLNTGVSNGSTSIPSGQGTIAAVVKGGGTSVAPKVSVSGTTVSWSFGSAPASMRSDSELTVLAY